MLTWLALSGMDYLPSINFGKANQQLEEWLANLVWTSWFKKVWSPNNTVLTVWDDKGMLLLTISTEKDIHKSAYDGHFVVAHVTHMGKETERFFVFEKAKNGRVLELVSV